MQAGIYIAKQKMLGTKYVVKIANGKIRLFDYESDQFLRVINPQYLKEFYDISFEPIKIEPKLFNIQWIVKSYVKEQILLNASYAACAAKVKELSISTHRAGRLIIIPAT